MNLFGVSLLVVGCGGFKASTSSGANASPLVNANVWPMRGFNSRHLGYQTAATTAATSTLRWKFLTNSTIQSQPAIDINTVYFGDITNNFYAVDPATGALKWKYVIGNQPGVNFVADTPLVAYGLFSDPTVIFGCGDGAVYALAGTNGALRWRFPTGARISFSSPTLDPNNHLYIGSQDFSLYALDAITGSLIWKYATAGRIDSSPSYANGIVYVGSQDGYVYAIDAQSGSLNWKYRTKGAVQSSPLVGPDGTVYIGSQDFQVYALNGTTGALKWRFAAKSYVDSSPCISADGKTIYIGSWDNYLYALDSATGRLNWSYMTGGPVNSTPSIDSYGKTLYVGSNDGYLYAWDISGTSRPALKWKAFTSALGTVGIDWSGPSIGSDGTVYVGSENGVYAFK